MDFAILASLGWTCWQVRTWSKTLKVATLFWGIALCCLSCILFLLELLGVAEVWIGIVVRVAALFYGASHFAICLLVTLIVASSFLNRFLKPKHESSSLNLTFLATRYVPLLIIAMLGAIVWATALNTLNMFGFLDGDSFAAFQQEFLTGVRYDVAIVEWILALVFALLGIIPLLAFIIYLIKGSGKIVHHTVGLILWVSPILLAIPALALIATYVVGFADGTQVGPSLIQHFYGESKELFYIYTWSAVRIVPWFALAVLPTAVVLNFIGDVALYILPIESEVSTRKKCRERFGLLFERLCKDKSEGLCIAGHSQGSVIAYDYLLNKHELGEFDLEKINLITLGSPIGTLYHKYLGWPLESPGCAWSNRYRTGDYIGGSIGKEIAKLHDCDIGEGGHTFYWVEEVVAQLILDQADSDSTLTQESEVRNVVAASSSKNKNNLVETRNE